MKDIMADLKTALSVVCAILAGLLFLFSVVSMAIAAGTGYFFLFAFLALVGVGGLWYGIYQLTL